MLEYVSLQPALQISSIKYLLELDREGEARQGCIMAIDQSLVSIISSATSTSVIKRYQYQIINLNERTTWY